MINSVLWCRRNTGWKALRSLQGGNRTHANHFEENQVEITPAPPIPLFPYPLSAIQWLEPYPHPPRMSTGNTAFFNEWHFSCHYETTRFSSYLRPCEPFISAKRLSADFNQIISTLRVSMIPNSPKSSDLGDLFSVTGEVFAFLSIILRIVSKGIEPSTVCA